MMYCRFLFSQFHYFVSNRETIKIKILKFMRDASCGFMRILIPHIKLGIFSKDITPTWYFNSINVGVLYKWKSGQHIGYLICGNIFTFPSTGINVRMKICKIVINICWVKCLKVYFLTIKFNVTHLKVSPIRSLK